jgi:ribosomal 30S subunit maturation factor RimM
MMTIYKNECKVYMVAQNRLDATDYENMKSQLKDHIQEHNKVHWYIEMEHFEGWSSSAYWKGIELKLPKEERLKRVALVGNLEWQEQFTEVLIPFTRAHIKFFDPDEKKLAKEWIEKEIN